MNRVPSPLIPKFLGLSVALALVMGAGAQVTPNDPLFSTNQWPLENPGGTLTPVGGSPIEAVADADIDAQDAWERTTGSRDVIVAIIDAGIDLDHPDLAANLWVNEDEIPDNGVDDDLNGYVDDVNGYDFSNADPFPDDTSGISHGTRVAGHIGMVGNNATLGTGVCWEVGLMPLRATSGGGLGAIVEAIDYAVNNGADIINASYGGFEFHVEEFEAISRAASADVVFVAATGNDALDLDRFPFYPATFDLPNLLSVGGSTVRDERGDVSNWGRNSVDLFAPAIPVYSTIRFGEGNPSGFAIQGGTSFAAPHATGVAALLRAQFPDMPAREIVERLRAGVDHPAALSELVRTSGRLSAAGIWSDDTVEPSAIEDLRLTEITSHGACLQFTAPGDDGDSGVAARWDARISLQPLTGENWDAAERLWDIPSPVPAGGDVAMRIARTKLDTLFPSTEYHVGVRAVDEAGNRGGLSNALTFTTAGETTLLFDDFETDSGLWIANAPWTRTDQEPAFSGSFVYHDSVGGNYAANEDASITLAQPFDLSVVTDAELSFVTYHDLTAVGEALVDFGAVEVSLSSGDWIPAHRVFNTATPHRRVRVPLARWAGEPNVRIRFRILSDASGHADGWWIDDVRIAVPERPLCSSPDVIVESFGPGDSPTLLDSYTEPASGEVWMTSSSKSTRPELDAKSARSRPADASAEAVFRPWVPVSGQYGVAMTWGTEANAASLEVRIESAGGADILLIDQDDSNANQWNDLGIFEFTRGNEGSIHIGSGAGTVDGGRASAALADAVRMRLVAPATNTSPSAGVTLH